MQKEGRGPTDIINTEVNEMLTINVSGWRKGYGPYSLNLPFDEHRKDYEIQFKDGTRCAQETPFQTEAHDWNNDGDIYPQHGAWFRDQDGRGEFFTPVVMLRLVIDEEAEIPGLLDPLAAIKGYVKAQEEEREARELAPKQTKPSKRRSIDRER